MSKRHNKSKPTFTSANDEQKFVLSDGRLLANIKDLADALEHISDDVFSHHVNDRRNDFSSWTREVLQEPELAEDLSGADSQLNAQITVLKHIAKKAF